MKAMPGVGVSATDQDAELRRFVAEARRSTALELAVELSRGWARGDDAETVVKDAAVFEAFIRDGQQPTTGVLTEVRLADLLRFLTAVRDYNVRTFAGEVSIHTGTSAEWTVTTEFARAAEQAGLVVETDPGQWVITPRGRETIDRGQV